MLEDIDARLFAVTKFRDGDNGDEPTRVEDEGNDFDRLLKDVRRHWVVSVFQNFNLWYD